MSRGLADYTLQFVQFIRDLEYAQAQLARVAPTPDMFTQSLQYFDDQLTELLEECRDLVTDMD